MGGGCQRDMDRSKISPKCRKTDITIIPSHETQSRIRTLSSVIRANNTITTTVYSWKDSAQEMSYFATLFRCKCRKKSGQNVTADDKNVPHTRKNVTQECKRKGKETRTNSLFLHTFVARSAGVVVPVSTDRASRSLRTFPKDSSNCLYLA